MVFPSDAITPLPPITLLVLVMSCAGNPGSPAGGAVTGTVAYRDRSALPPDAVVQVQLSDVSRQDAPATVVAQTTVEPAGRQAPLPFELRYDPGTIEPTHSYSVRATIRSGGRLLYTSTAAAPVITRGNPDHVELMLARAGGAAEAGPGAVAAKLAGTSWRLAELGGAAPLEGVEATLEFPAPGRVGGRGSCNRFSGSVEVMGDSVKFGQLVSTMMACAEPIMKQEQEFLNALQAAGRYSIDGDVLLLYPAGAAPPLRFARAEP